MRAAIVAALLTVLSACAMTPAKHALIAVSASTALRVATELAQQQMDNDSAEVGGINAAEADKQKLDEHWDPIIAGLAGGKRALAFYESAIRAADENGDESLLKTAAREFLDAWVKALAAADAFGAPFPLPPKKLSDYVRGDS